MHHRSNGFDALRLLGAVMVIVGHSFPLTGQIAPYWVGALGSSIATTGVKIFFVISGYLITTSWLSDPNFLRYWRRRFLRIMPALIVICVLSAYLAGPLLTSLSAGEYFSNSHTRHYLWNIALYPHYNLPGVFTDNIYPNAVNGSIWSLPVEVLMYIFVPLVLGLRFVPLKFLVPVFAAALIAASLTFTRGNSLDPVFWGTGLLSVVEMAPYFWIGATFAVLGLQRFANAPLSIGLFVGALLLTPANATVMELTLMVTLSYLVISIGTSHIAALRFLRGHDYSYGLFLYGFPVQQTIVHFLGPLTPAANMALALPIALVFAILSWHLVEKRALELKPRRKTEPTGPADAQPIPAE